MWDDEGGMPPGLEIRGPDATRSQDDASSLGSAKERYLTADSRRRGESLVGCDKRRAGIASARAT